MPFIESTSIQPLVRDPQFLGSCLLALLVLGYVVEVLSQVRLQARFLTALPVFARAALPPHPRQAWLGFLGSPRFAMAVWRAFRRDQPDDTDTVVTLKRQMRASLRREVVLASAAVVLGTVLVATGWRPI